MVCVPCVLFPVLFAIYLKFIQPLILRLIPERWRRRIDSLLCPTANCPIDPPGKVPAKSSSFDDQQKPLGKVSTLPDGDGCCTKRSHPQPLESEKDE